MSETRMSGIIKAALESIRGFADCDISVGNIISTPSGVCVIPLSKVTVGLATGGVDYSGTKSSSKDNFGGGGGTGVCVTPMAVLTVNRDGEIRIINLSDSSDGIDKFADILGKAPEIIDKFKNMML